MIIDQQKINYWRMINQLINQPSDPKTCIEPSTFRSGGGPAFTRVRPKHFENIAYSTLGPSKMN